MSTNRYELTDEQWARLEPLLPRGGVGRPWHDHRRVLNGILWVLRSGAPWRDVPRRYGKFRSLHARFTKWRQDGTWDRLVEALQAELDNDGLLDWSLWCVDGSNVRAARCAAGAAKKGGPTTSRTIMPSVAHVEATERSSTS